MEVTSFKTQPNGPAAPSQQTTPQVACRPASSVDAPHVTGQKEDTPCSFESTLPALSPRVALFQEISELLETLAFLDQLLNDVPGPEEETAPSNQAPKGHDAEEGPSRLPEAQSQSTTGSSEHKEAVGPDAEHRNQETTAGSPAAQPPKTTEAPSPRTSVDAPPRSGEELFHQTLPEQAVPQAGRSTSTTPTPLLTSASLPEIEVQAYDNHVVGTGNSDLNPVGAEILKALNTLGTHCDTPDGIRNLTTALTAILEREGLSDLLDYDEVSGERANTPPHEEIVDTSDPTTAQHLRKGLEGTLASVKTIVASSVRSSGLAERIETYTQEVPGDAHPTAESVLRALLSRPQSDGNPAALRDAFMRAIPAFDAMRIARLLLASPSDQSKRTQNESRNSSQSRKRRTLSRRKSHLFDERAIQYGDRGDKHHNAQDSAERR